MNREVTITNTATHAQNNSKVRTITATAMLSAIAYLMAFAEFPVPLSPAFARMDLSDFPALIGTFAYGPLVGVLIELIKNGLQLLSTSTGGVGEFANFLMGGSFVLTAGLIYRQHKSRKTAWIACLISSVVMGIVAAAANYFILLPMFEMFMPFIRTKLDVVLYNAFPFNLLKGLVISIFTMAVYKRLTPVLKGTR